MIKYASSIHIDRDAMVPFESAPKLLLSFWHPISSFRCPELQKLTMVNSKDLAPV